MTDLFLGPGGLPDFAPETQAFLRSAYGVVMLVTLALAIPQARRFFLSERWGGYTGSSRAFDLVGRPAVIGPVLALWIAANVLLAAGRLTVWAAALNLVICHHFFVRLRWRSVLRGMGAPGFMSFWLGGAVFVLELASRYAPDARNLAVLVVGTDLALIFLSAGVYKLLGGYRKGEGVDLGLANPQWGYWWRFWSRVPPRHPSLRLLNQLGWVTEVVAAALMLIPQLRFLGGALIILTFGVIRTQIRLGVLCEIVMLAAVVTFHRGSAGAEAVDGLFGWLPVTAPAGATDLAPVLRPVLVAYLVLVVLAHVGLAVNLYRHRSLAGPLQRALELFTNTFGVIVWRVFTVDVVNFYVRIARVTEDGRVLVARWGWTNGLRYAQVGEAITVTSLFTALKYHPSDQGRFRERLLRYARTVPRLPGEVLVFEYVALVKRERCFEHVPSAEFRVDVDAGTVEEVVLEPEYAPARVSEHSPVHEGSRPGSYAPAAP